LKPKKIQKVPTATPAQVPVAEADFDDTIALNRAIPILDPASVPRSPPGFRLTDSDTRNRRLRKLAAEDRAEAVNALEEAGARDLKADLGKYAPSPTQAPPLAQRLVQTGELVAVAQSLLAYAREVDQIALSDALVFLEAEHKQLEHAVEHEPALATRYRALGVLFAARTDAILEGRARAAKEAAPAPAPAPEGAVDS
jgi:hypothetical protein